MTESLEQSNITINAHSSIRVDGERFVIYFDPYLVDNAPRDATVIFITHNHFDHLSKEDMDKVAGPGCDIIIPISILQSLKDNGIITGSDENCHVNADFEQRNICGKNCYGGYVIGLRPGDEGSHKLGFNYKAVRSYNTNKPNHKKQYDWLGYVVDADGMDSIYVAGDTDVIPEMDEVSADVFIVPIGGTYTMDEAEAADMINRLSPKVAVPSHYGSIVGDSDAGRRFATLVKGRTKVVCKI